MVRSRLSWSSIVALLFVVAVLAQGINASSSGGSDTPALMVGDKVSLTLSPKEEDDTVSAMLRAETDLKGISFIARRPDCSELFKGGKSIEFWYGPGSESDEKCKMSMKWSEGNFHMGKGSETDDFAAKAIVKVSLENGKKAHVENPDHPADDKKNLQMTGCPVEFAENPNTDQGGYVMKFSMKGKPGCNITLDFGDQFEVASTTTPPPSSTEKPSSGESSSNGSSSKESLSEASSFPGWLIAVIVVVAVVVLAIVGALIFYFCFYRRRRPNKKREAELKEVVHGPKGMEKKNASQSAWGPKQAKEVTCISDTLDEEEDNEKQSQGAIAEPTGTKAKETKPKKDTSPKKEKPKKDAAPKKESKAEKSSSQKKADSLPKK